MLDRGLNDPLIANNEMDIPAAMDLNIRIFMISSHAILLVLLAHFIIYLFYLFYTFIIELTEILTKVTTEIVTTRLINDS